MHTLIHYFDLNPVITELNKLHLKSTNLTNFVKGNKEYTHDAQNYLKILSLTKERVETKLKEILPHPQRTKRGLINGLGSIFKAITGNLDASDGERYEHLIEELQDNQNKLASNIVNQNSLSLDIVNKFSNTVQQLKHNDELLQSKIDQVAILVEQQTYRENSMFIKDILNQFTNLYGIINSILQDIENSISFAKLKVMHPSIISTTDFYYELSKLHKQVKPNQFPFEVTLENTLLFEKFTQVDCFIFNNKITYLLHIPIMYEDIFKYYRLYTVPIKSQSQFKAIIPKSKYLLQSELFYAYEVVPCLEILPKYHVCNKIELQPIQSQNPCEIQLLNMKNTSICQQIDVQVNKPIVKQLEETNEWVVLLPRTQSLKLRCDGDEEIRRMTGTYLIQVPAKCEVNINGRILTNELRETNSNKPVLLPELEDNFQIQHSKNFTIHLEDIDWDDLQNIKTRIVENHPSLTTSTISVNPSAWTIVIYGLLIIIVLYWCFNKKPFERCKKTTVTTTAGATNLQEIQIPH